MDLVKRFHYVFFLLVVYVEIFCFPIRRFLQTIHPSMMCGMNSLLLLLPTRSIYKFSFYIRHRSVWNRGLFECQVSAVAI